MVLGIKMSGIILIQRRRKPHTNVTRIQTFWDLFKLLDMRNSQELSSSSEVGYDVFRNYSIGFYMQEVRNVLRRSTGRLDDGTALNRIAP